MDKIRAAAAVLAAAVMMSGCGQAAQTAPVTEQETTTTAETTAAVFAETTTHSPNQTIADMETETLENAPETTTAEVTTAAETTTTAAADATEETDSQTETSEEEAELPEFEGRDFVGHWLFSCMRVLDEEKEYAFSAVELGEGAMETTTVTLNEDGTAVLTSNELESKGSWKEIKYEDGYAAEITEIDEETQSESVYYGLNTGDYLVLVFSDDEGTIKIEFVREGSEPAKKLAEEIEAAAQTASETAVEGAEASDEQTEETTS